MLCENGCISLISQFGSAFYANPRLLVDKFFFYSCQSHVRPAGRKPLVTSVFRDLFCGLLYEKKEDIQGMGWPCYFNKEGTLPKKVSFGEQCWHVFSRQSRAGGSCSEMANHKNENGCPLTTISSISIDCFKNMSNGQRSKPPWRGFK